MTKRDELIALADRMAALPTFKMATVVTVPGVACDERERDLIVTALRLSALEAPAAGDGEPVAWIDFAENDNIRLWTSEKRRADAEMALGRKMTPVYTAQPSDAAMREAVIEECARELETSYPDHAWLNAACAAIRALTAPGATTKSDGGLVPATGPVQTGDVLRYEVDEVSRVGEVIEHLRPSDPSSTRSEVTVAELARSLRHLGKTSPSYEAGARAMLDQFEIRRK